MTVSEIAKRAKISRAAARRFMLTLADLGYVGVDGERYFLRPQILDLGYAFVSSMRLEELVQPYVNRVAELTGASSSVAVLAGSDILFVVRASTKRLISFSVSIGTRLPASSTAMGRVLLAGLSENGFDSWLKDAQLPRFNDSTISKPSVLKREVQLARRQGWAMIRGEMDEAIEAIAIPITGPSGKTVASICISTSGGKLSDQAVCVKYLDILREASSEISGLLRTSPLFLPE